MEPKFPDITVQLSEQDGNAFYIIGRVRSAMRRAGLPNEDIADYTKKATSGNYDNVLRVTMETVDVA